MEWQLSRFCNRVESGALVTKLLRGSRAFSWPPYAGPSPRPEPHARDIDRGEARLPSTTTAGTTSGKSSGSLSAIKISAAEVGPKPCAQNCGVQHRRFQTNEATAEEPEDHTCVDAKRGATPLPSRYFDSLRQIQGAACRTQVEHPKLSAELVVQVFELLVPSRAIIRDKHLIASGNVSTV